MYINSLCTCTNLLFRIILESKNQTCFRPHLSHLSSEGTWFLRPHTLLFVFKPHWKRDTPCSPPEAQIRNSNFDHVGQVSKLLLVQELISNELTERTGRIKIPFEARCSISLLCSICTRNKSTGSYGFCFPGLCNCTSTAKRTSCCFPTDQHHKGN